MNEVQKRRVDIHQKVKNIRFKKTVKESISCDKKTFLGKLGGNVFWRKLRMYECRILSNELLPNIYRLSNTLALGSLYGVI